MPRLLPPAYFYRSIALMLLLRWLLPLGRIIPQPRNLLGFLPLALGTALALAGSQAFRRAGTTLKPFQPSPALVTSGNFRFSRNPMYLSMALGLAGVALLLLGALSPFFVLPLFVWLIQRRFIAFEERTLAQAFGSAYAAYQRRTRRWLLSRR